MSAHMHSKNSGKNVAAGGCHINQVFCLFCFLHIWADSARKLFFAIPFIAWSLHGALFDKG